MLSQELLDKTLKRQELNTWHLTVNDPLKSADPLLQPNQLSHLHTSLRVGVRGSPPLFFCGVIEKIRYVKDKLNSKFCLNQLRTTLLKNSTCCGEEVKQVMLWNIDSGSVVNILVECHFASFTALMASVLIILYNYCCCTILYFIPFFLSWPLTTCCRDICEESWKILLQNLTALLNPSPKLNRELGLCEHLQSESSESEDYARRTNTENVRT